VKESLQGPLNSAKLRKIAGICRHLEPRYQATLSDFIRSTKVYLIL